eukprot:gene86-11556_t
MARFTMWALLMIQQPGRQGGEDRCVPVPETLRVPGTLRGNCQYRGHCQCRRHCRRRRRRHQTVGRAPLSGAASPLVHRLGLVLVP